MSEGGKWHECACGDSIKVSDSDMGRIMLAEWRKIHREHVGESYENGKLSG